MSYTTAQLTALETALATGELTVVFEGKSVTYRSIEQLKRAIDIVRADLIANGLLTDSTPRVSYAAFDRN